MGRVARVLTVTVFLRLLQGMGNLVNGCVILICMGMFNMTGMLLAHLHA
jgi:hypothetical protein